MPTKAAALITSINLGTPVRMEGSMVTRDGEGEALSFSQKKMLDR